MKKKFTDAEYPMFEIVVDDSDTTGIRLLSIVDQPAIEMKGVAFSAEGATKGYEFQAQADKQIIVGPAMIPNMKILRKDSEGNKYFVVFKPDTIEKMVQKFNASGNNRRINVDHSTKMVQAYIMENWIVADTYYDKSRMYNFDVPIGTWMVSVKIEDQDFWKNEVKDLGKFGFSIEGVMAEKPMQYSTDVESATHYSVEEMIDLLTDDELLELVDSEFKVWRSKSKSSNVNRMSYNDQSKELVVKFNSGDIYTYFDVDFGIFKDVYQGIASCTTTGSNQYGSWYFGKTPSVGAAVYHILVKHGYSYKKGGTLK